MVVPSLPDLAAAFPASTGMFTFSKNRIVPSLLFGLWDAYQVTYQLHQRRSAEVPKKREAQSIDCWNQKSCCNYSTAERILPRSVTVKHAISTPLMKPSNPITGQTGSCF